MKILPFIVSKPYDVQIIEHSIKVYRIAFLLDKGTDLWIEAACDLKDLLETNDLYSSKIVDYSDIKLVAIDLTKTALEEFYFYDDENAPSEGLIWRSFFYFYDSSTGASFMDGWKYPEAISNYIDNALKVWNSI